MKGAKQVIQRLCRLGGFPQVIFLLYLAPHSIYSSPFSYFKHSPVRNVACSLQRSWIASTFCL